MNTEKNFRNFNFLIFSRRALIAVAIFFLWKYALTIGYNIFNINKDPWEYLNFMRNFGRFSSHSLGIIVAIISLFIYSFFDTDIKLGKIKDANSIKFIFYIFLLYFLFSVLENLFGFQKEEFTKNIFNVSIYGQIATAFTIFLIAPIAEEIIFRGFLLNPFIKYGKWFQLAGIILISLLFAYLHKSQYQLFTLIQLFLFSVMLSFSRIKSGGLLLPIILHSEAAFLAVLFNKII